MSSDDFLTAGQLLEELRSAGAEVEERTLRYWTSRKLLPKPVKKPFRGADGRVGYYPSEILQTISEILRLQAEGWKLEQIRRQLQAPKKRATKSVVPGAQEFSRKYLEDLLTDHAARERRQLLYSDDSGKGDLRRLRRQLVGRLERLVGRQEAVRAVTSFLLSLSNRQVKRLAHRLRPQPISESSTDPSLDWVARESEWKDENRLGALCQRVEQWKGLPKSEAPPVIGRRAAFLAEKLQALLLSMKSKSGLHRKPLAAEIGNVLREFEQLIEQAETNAQFLEAETTNTD